MPKRAHIALSAVLSLMAVASPVVAGGNKRSLSMAPYMIPAAAPPRPVAGARSTNLSLNGMHRLAAGSYPSTHLQRGQYLQQKGDIDAALVEFLKAAQENPLQVKAFYEQAKIFKQKGYNKLAESSLQQALAVRPDYRDARVLLASLYLESGNVSQAAKELVRSLGLDSDTKKSSAPAPESDRFLGLPIRVPTIVQTPHGILRAPAVAPPAQQPAAGNKEPASDPFASTHQSDQIKQARTKTAVAGDIASAFSAQASKTSDSDDDILKRVLGIDPNAPAAATATNNQNSAPLAAAAAQVGIQQESSRKAAATSADATAATAAGVKSVPVDPHATTVRSLSQDQAQQLLQQVKKGKEGGGFSFLNPFAWFGGDGKGAAAPKPYIEKAPPEDPILRKVEERARKSERQGRARKPRVAAWMDGLLDGGHTQPQTTAIEPLKRTVRQTSPLQTVILDDKGDNDFNPISTLEGKSAKPERSGLDAPVLSDRADLAQPPPPATLPAPDEVVAVLPKPMDITHMFKRAVSWLPLPMFKPLSNDNIRPSVPDASLLNAAPPPLPPLAPVSARPTVPLPAPQSRADRYIANLPAPVLIAPQPARLTAPEVGSAPVPVHACKPLPGFLGFLPREIAGTLAHVLSPRAVALSTSTAPPPIQQTGNSGGRAAEQSPVTVMRKTVYDNIVGARFGPGSMPEEANPVVQRSTTPPRLLARAPMLAPVEALSPAPPVMPPAPAATNASHPMPGVPEPVVARQKTTMLVQLAPRLHGGNSYPAMALPVPAPMSLPAPVPMPLPTRAPMPTQAPMPLPGRAALPIPARAPMPLQAAMPPGASPAPEVVAPTWHDTYGTAGTAISAPAPQRAPALQRMPVASVPNLLPPPPRLSTAPAAAPNLPPVAQRLSVQGFRFVGPQLSPQQQQLMKTLRAVKPAAPHLVAGKPVLDQSVVLAEDAWAKRMKFLLEHGTNSLAPGEAFMFSEETGEGVLFLADHNSIRRKIAAPQGHEQVARLRRPDILNQNGELQYNLSLLGKIIKPGDAKKATLTPKLPHAPTAPSVEDPPDSASVADLLGGRQQGFFGWLKTMFKM